MRHVALVALVVALGSLVACTEGALTGLQESSTGEAQLQNSTDPSSNN